MAEAKEIKERIATFLGTELKLTLSAEKTLITHANTGRARFLGYEIGIMDSQTKFDHLQKTSQSMEELACTYPRTSFKQSVNGISGTANQYTDLNSSTIANMTSLPAIKENTGAWSITTDWHKTLQS